MFYPYILKFYLTADTLLLEESLSDGSDSECKPGDREMPDLGGYPDVDVLTS